MSGLSSRTTSRMVAMALATGVALSVALFLDTGREYTFYIFLALTAVIMLILAESMVGKKVTAKMEFDGILLSGPMFLFKLPFNEMSKIELRDSIDKGMRFGGFSGSKKVSGKYKNEEFGLYDINVDQRISKYIVLRRITGVYLVFNLSSENETVTFYDELRKWVKK